MVRVIDPSLYVSLHQHTYNLNGAGVVKNISIVGVLIKVGVGNSTSLYLIGQVEERSLEWRAIV